MRTNFITDMSKEKEMNQDGMNKHDEPENLFIDEPLTIDENLITFDPTTREIGKVKEMWREKDAKKRQRRKMELTRKLRMLAPILLLAVPVMLVAKINTYIESRQIKKCTDELSSYELFIPNDRYFYDEAYKKMGPRDEFDMIDHAEEMKVTYQIYKETMLSLKEKWNFQMICFSSIPTENDKGNYFTTYDIEMTDKLLEFTFFELKDGYSFMDNRNEVWALGKDKKNAPAVIDFESVDGKTYYFDVVGTMKYDFLPVGLMLDASSENMIAEISDRGITYLINPYCDFLKGKELVGNISKIFIIFDEENKIEAKKELEQYGYFTTLK